MVYYSNAMKIKKLNCKYLIFGGTFMFENFYRILGFTSGLIVVCLLAKKWYEKAQEYDERQVLARGKAAQISFITLMSCMLFCAIAGMAEIKWADTSALIFIGIFISALVFAGISIFSDAYFTPKGNRYVLIFSFSCLGIINLIIFLTNSDNTTELLRNNALNMYAGIFSIILALMIIIKTLIDRKTVGE